MPSSSVQDVDRIMTQWTYKDGPVDERKSVGRQGKIVVAPTLNGQVRADGP